MFITSKVDGTTAVLTARGEIDFDALPELVNASAALPPSVTEVTWELREAPFMDIAGLHLLIHQRLACEQAGRKLTVTGLHRQPLHLLEMAQNLFPDGRWNEFLPDSAAASEAAA
ncbi:STAS domain-containing protein [Streptomyces sp. NPDC001941]|uniref:STAS domain-containing protein n=1 Tax=Streptomyces sp. NPDC001941 TaxID=3154659 RepID=UPI00331D7AF4